MKFLLPDTKLYNACAVLLRILTANVVVIMGIMSVVGINFSLMITKEIFEKHSIKVFLPCVTLRLIFQSIIASLLSAVLVLLSYFNNLYLVDTNIIRWIYIFLWVFIIYCIVVINLFFLDITQKKITLSQLFGVAAINYPKFVFFFSITSAIAVLMYTTLFYALLVCYVGTIMYTIYRIEMPYILALFENEEKKTQNIK